jgi:hypothetical protein
MVALSSQGGHSAVVTMRLLLDGVSIPVAQMGPDFILLETPLEHPPATGSLVLNVDETERQWKVRLPQGIFADAKRVAIAACA